MLKAFKQEDYTLSAWLKVTEGFLSGQHVVFGQSNQGIHNGVRNGGFLHTAHWGNDFNAGTVLDEDTWFHALWTYNNVDGIAEIWLNGEKDLEDQPPDVAEWRWVLDHWQSQWRR